MACRPQYLALTVPFLEWIGSMDRPSAAGTGQLDIRILTYLQRKRIQGNITLSGLIGEKEKEGVAIRLGRARSGAAHPAALSQANAGEDIPNGRSS